MSSPLFRHGREAASIFDLLGHQEVDATGAVGFADARVVVVEVKRDIG